MLLLRDLSPSAGAPRANDLKLRRERRPAPATFLCVRILENETGMNQRIFPVKRHPVEEYHALRVDKHLNVFEVKYMICRPRLQIELELIAQSGTAASQHAESQATVDALACKSLSNLLDCLWGNVYDLCCRRRRAGLRRELR
jgi:hypothetical protein